ncbi:TPA: glycosyltransferase, partial [Vibrio parahaemolyticus]
YLLEALSMIENVDDYRLTIIGEGPLKSELEKLIDDYSLKSVVKIIPFTSNPYCYFHKANFLVFPSLYEGYPNVICESLILGCPVLAFDFKSGSRELVSKENGKLVALKDVVGLADSISKFDYKGYNVNSEGINSVEALASQYQSVIGL